MRPAKNLRPGDMVYQMIDSDLAWKTALVISVTQEPCTDYRDLLSPTTDIQANAPYITLFIDGRRVQEYTALWVANRALTN